MRIILDFERDDTLNPFSDLDFHCKGWITLMDTFAPDRLDEILKALTWHWRH